MKDGGRDTDGGMSRRWQTKKVKAVCKVRRSGRA